MSIVNKVGLNVEIKNKKNNKGKITFETLHAELGEIVCGLKQGREASDETILFWHRGLSLSDIALGYKILSKAKEIGVGQKLRFA